MWKLLTGRLYAPEDGSGGGAPPAAPPAGSVPDAHPVTAPWAAVTDGPWKVGEAGKEQEWWNTIPEQDVREHVKAKGYKNPAELAMANLSLTKMQRGSTDVLAVPKADAPQNEWDAFYTKMGRPATPMDYDFKLTADDPTVDPKMVEFGKKFFHKLGVPAAKAPEAVKEWNAYVAEQNAAAIQAEQTKNDKDMAALETEWGADLNEHKAAGERVVKALKLDEPTMNAIESKIGTAPLVRLLMMIGKKSAEGTLIGGGGGGDPNNPDNMSKEQAEAAINALNNDATFQKMYTDAKDPGHDEAVKRMQKLYART